MQGSNKTKIITACDAVGDFRKCTSGSATIEACLWLPFFVFFLIMIVDVTMILRQDAHIQRIVYDGNRQFQAGAFTNANGLKLWIEGEVRDLAPNAVATAVLDSSGLLTTTVQYPASDTDLSNAVGVLSKLSLRATAIHQIES